MTITTLFLFCVNIEENSAKIKRIGPKKKKAQGWQK
jgi:hypothetical protein